MAPSYMMYKLHDDHGNIDRWIEGERYFTSLWVRETLPHSSDPPPCSLNPLPPVPEEAGKEYLIISAMYVNHARGAAKTRVTCLFGRDRVVERRGFDFSTVSEMFSDVPWRLPEVLLPPIGPWLRECKSDAAVKYFPSARVLYFQLWIAGPYRPGGDEYLEIEVPEPCYGSLMKAQLKRVQRRLRVDQTCAICLRRFVGSRKGVVSTHCSQIAILFYNHRSSRKEIRRLAARA